MLQGWAVSPKACPAALLLASVGWAAPSERAVSVAWVRDLGAESCISRQEIVSKVRRRLGTDPFTGEPGQWLEGVIRREGHSWTATLYERDAEGNTLGTREFQSESEDCRELDEAIVLMVALLIDPEGGRGRTSGDEATPDRAFPARASPDRELGSKGDPPENQARTPPQGNSRPSPPATRSQEPHDRVACPDRPSGRAHAGALLAYAMLPGWAAGLTLELQVLTKWPLRAAVFHFPEKVERTPEGSLALSASALELGLCSPTGEAARVWPFGCLSVAGGALHSAAYADVPRPPLERFWAALRGDLGLAARIVGPLGFDVRVSAWVPMIRYRFRVEDNPTVFVQPWVIAGAQAAVTLQLW